MVMITNRSEPNAPTRRNSNDRRDSTDFKELGQDYVLKGRVVGLWVERINAEYILDKLST